MIFKEQTDIKPYALLSFPKNEHLQNYIKIHGDRRTFVPDILARIEEQKTRTHFGGSAYTIAALEAKNIDLPPLELGRQTTVHFVSPVALVTKQRMELIPSLLSILKASVRAYNRVTKYYDRENYPYSVSDEILNADMPIVDFDVKQVEWVHETMEKRKILLNGVSGWVRYDTTASPVGTGDVLRMGEFLQIGKHTTYGFGGMVVSKGASS
jgi:hypothetical protein